MISYTSEKMISRNFCYKVKSKILLGLHCTVWKSHQKHDHFFCRKINIFSVINSTFLLKSWFHGNFCAWSRFIALFDTVHCTVWKSWKLSLTLFYKNFVKPTVLLKKELISRKKLVRENYSFFHTVYCEKIAKIYSHHFSWQNLREINASIAKLYCKLLSRNFLQVRVIFSFFYTVFHFSTFFQFQTTLDLTWNQVWPKKSWFHEIFVKKVWK